MLDWRIRPLLWAQNRLSGPEDVSRLTGPRARAEFRALLRRSAPILVGRTPGVVVQDSLISVAGGRILGRWYLPRRAEGLPVIVYFHGGGWVVGDVESYDPFCRALCARSGALVLAVEYRLAPDNAAPTAAEDAYAGFLAAHAGAGRLGGDPARITVMGDSAGGNLAAVVSLLARDRGGPRPARQALVYPVTDGLEERPSYAAFGEGHLLDRARMRWYWEQYAPSREQRASPYVSPLRAASLEGLPPALVLTASHDILRDEGEAYAERLREAGVPVEQRRAPGMLHGFLMMQRLLPEARYSLGQLAAFARA